MDPIISVEEFCRATGDDPNEVVRFFLDGERARLVAHKAKLEAENTSRPAEALPLAVGKDEFGRVAASIPEDLFYHLMSREGFGMKQRLADRDGMTEIVKAFPQCRVNTVSGKTTVGWRRGGRWAGSSRVNLKNANFVK